MASKVAYHPAQTVVECDGQQGQVRKAVDWTGNSEDILHQVSLASCLEKQKNGLVQLFSDVWSPYC